MVRNTLQKVNKIGVLKVKQTKRNKTLMLPKPH